MKLNFPLERPVGDVSGGKWRSYGVGIDVHKEMVWCCVLIPDYVNTEQQRHIAKFETSLAGLSSMVSWLEGLVQGKDRHFLVEATSTYHFPVLLALRGWVATVINPRNVGSAKRKTDRWDAQKLAHHDMVATFPAYVLPTQEETGLRSAMRRWVKISRAINRNVSALRTRLCMYGVNWYEPIDSPSGFARFSHLCTGRGEFVYPSNPADAEQFSGLLRLSDRIPRVVRDVNCHQLAEVDALGIQRQQVWDLALRAADVRSLLLLRTVPHVNDTTALVFLGEVGRHPLRRFSSIRGIVSYCGFDPSKKISADQVTSHVPCVGNKHLRRVFLQCASGVMLSKASSLSASGRMVADRSGKKGWFAGVNYIGRKLVRYCSSVLISNTPFTEGLVHGEAETNRVLSRVSGTASDVDCGQPVAFGWDSSVPTEAPGQGSEWGLGDAEG